jgi:carboxyl-terminal processing protease
MPVVALAIRMPQRLVPRTLFKPSGGGSGVDAAVKPLDDPAVIARAAELRGVALEAWDIFRDRYVDNQGIDWDRMRSRLERRSITTEHELHDAIEWMLAQARDQFTRFLPRNELSAMKDDIDGEMCGVGIVFTAESYGWRRTKRVIVKEVVRNSPAADAGLSRGDEITAIDTSTIRHMSVDDATNRLLGKQGHKVSISFIRCDDRVEMSVTLTRRRFIVPTVSGEAVAVPGIGRVAFLQVREFAANTGLQARTIIRRLGRSGPIHMYVLDLRGNSGGLVDQAVEFARVFLNRHQVIVRFVGRDGAITFEKSGTPWFYRQRVRVLDEPVVVLVDEATASASELVAAALRENCRAVIVGASTYGKGSVQAIAQLSDGAGVAITVAEYRTPSNTPILAGRGLKPDLFKPAMADDAAAVTQLLANNPRRLKWIRSRLASCTPPPQA